MDDGRNVGVRFIEPTGKLPKRKEVLAEIVRFEDFYESGSDESDPYENSPHPPSEWGKKVICNKHGHCKASNDKGLGGGGEIKKQ